MLIVIAAVLYTAITYVGVRALTIIGLIAAPLYVVLGLVAVAIIAKTHDLGAVTQFAGHAGGMTFAGAVTLVVATFADSGTMTADFTRWSRSGREAVLARAHRVPRRQPRVAALRRRPSSRRAPRPRRRRTAATSFR